MVSKRIPQASIHVLCRDSPSIMRSLAASNKGTWVVSMGYALRRMPPTPVFVLAVIAFCASLLSTLGSLVLVDQLEIPAASQQPRVRSLHASRDPPGGESAFAGATWRRAATGSSAANSLSSGRNISAAEASTLSTTGIKHASSSIVKLFRRDKSCPPDVEPHCAEWASSGECDANPEFMHQNCARACGICGGGKKSTDPAVVGSAAGNRQWADGKCSDTSSYCGQWAAVGECDSNPHYMKFNCPVTCHLCQSAECHDEDPTKCASLALEGECRRDPEQMYKQCRWACKWCAMKRNSRCVRPAGAEPAARRGTVEFMFGVAATQTLYRTTVLMRSPWVVQFDDFLSDEEVQRIIDVGGRGWSRSQAGDGVQAVRTSSTAWCEPTTCQRDSVMARIRSRIANLTMVPELNAEHMQARSPPH